MNKLLFILLLPLTTFAQDFINSSEFNSKTAKGISVVEFWAEWNKSNEVDFLGNLKDCNSYKLCIVKNSATQKEYNVSAIPTIIIFDNGEEKERFLPNIMFQLEVDKKIIQHSVDTITLNKFQ